MGVKSVYKFIKDWMLVFAMIIGASAYTLYHFTPALHAYGAELEQTVRIIQPMLLFIMLFMSFMRIDPRCLKPHIWQLWLLIIQVGSFVALAVLFHFFPEIPGRLSLESFMLCMICPTATAAAVVTNKLGGSMAGVMTYTIMINLAVAIVVPLIVPMMYPVNGISFFSAFLRIIAKIFPMLILPCLLAWLVKWISPAVYGFIEKHPDIPFYIWACSLALAILMATRALFHCEDGILTILGIALSSLFACFIQFFLGKKIGSRYNETVTGGQALGQKNTVFAMWMCYVFMNPVVSIAGGFYSIWHNVYNSWQIKQANNR